MKSKKMSVILLFALIAGVLCAKTKDVNDLNSSVQKETLEVSVDPRIEAISLIFRLAGNFEYNRCNIPSYDNDINTYFKPYKTHEAVKYAKYLREKFGVCFGAPMSLAVYISDINSMELSVLLSPRPSGLDDRWKDQELVKFLELAEDFVKDSNFIDFYNEHEKLYTKTSDKFQKLIDEKAHFEWFDNYFYAHSNHEFCIRLGMMNGPSSYGSHSIINGQQNMYSIIGVYKTDFWGNPVFHQGFIATVVHELGHSYVNPVVIKHQSLLEPSGKILFEKVKGKMKKMAYGRWQTMMTESVNRVCTIQYYMQYRNKSDVERLIKYEIENGFFWTRELNEVVSKYAANRDNYKNFDEFFPEIVSFFNSYVEKEF